MKSLTFDHNLDLLDLSESLRKQFKMREIIIPSIEAIMAYAAVCDAHAEGDYVEFVRRNSAGAGASSKSSICIILAALYCFVPHDMGKVIMAEFGVEISCT